MDLTDRCRPMATRVVPYILGRATGHDGTIRWPLQRKFSKVVLADRLQTQEDRQQHDMRGTADTCKDDLHGQDVGLGSTCQCMRDGLHGQHMERGLQSRRNQQDIALIHGPQSPCVQMRPQSTSQTDVGQQPSEWCHACLREPLAMMGPSDSRSDDIFQKVVIVDRLQPQRDHQRHAKRGTLHACKTSHAAKMSDEADRPNTCKTNCIVNMWNVVHTANTGPTELQG